MPKIKDMQGKRFGRLVVLRFDHLSNSGAQWLTRCDCGTEKVVIRDNLRTGNTKSCGCLRKEITRNRGRTHGATRTSEYVSWQGIIDRTTNPRCHAYELYGGRGITVCEEWRGSFEVFLAYVGPKPGPEYSIDRINNAGNYEPGNVRWATPTEQSRNRRNNLMLTHDGQTKTLAEWAEVTGKSREKIQGRLRLGWPIERAITAT